MTLNASIARGDSLATTVDGALAKSPRDVAFYSGINARLDTCVTICHSADGGTAAHSAR